MNLIVPKLHERSLGKELRDALLICLFAAAALTSACHHDSAKGPAERAGESVDHAARKTKDTVKGAVDGAKAGARGDDDHH